MLKIQHSEGLNIVPFIDVILVLLAMVLSISTFIAHGEIKIELPKSDSSMQSSNDSNKIQILINAQDVYYLEDKETTLEEIQKELILWINKQLWNSKVIKMQLLIVLCKSLIF